MPRLDIFELALKLRPPPLGGGRYNLVPPPPFEFNQGDIERVARHLHPDEDEAKHLGYHAPYVAWRYALQHSWITQAEYDNARVRSGRLWNYCGD